MHQVENYWCPRVSNTSAMAEGHTAGALEERGIQSDVFTTTGEADRTDVFIPMLLMKTQRLKVH